MSKIPDPLKSSKLKAKGLCEKVLKKRGHANELYRALLNNPELTAKVSDLGERLSFAGKLPGDVREVVILYVAQQSNVGYEWVNHEPSARSLGVPDVVIECLRSGQALPLHYEYYRQAINIVQFILKRESIPHHLQERFVSKYGTGCLVELVILTGFYLMMGGAINAFDVDLPKEKKWPF